MKREPIVRMPATPRSLILTALKITKRPLSRALLMAALKQGLVDKYEASRERDRVVIRCCNKLPDGSMLPLPDGVRYKDFCKIYYGARYVVARDCDQYHRWKETTVCINFTDKYLDTKRNCYIRLPCVRINYGNVAKSEWEYEVIGWTQLKKYLIPLRCEVHWIDGVENILSVGNDRPNVAKVAQDKWGNDMEYFRRHQHPGMIPHITSVLVRYTDERTTDKLFNIRKDLAVMMY